MQRSLVNHRTGYKRVAVLFQRDGQAFKPFGPPIIQVSLQADFVADRVYLRWSHERKYTGWVVSPGSNLSIVWSIVLGLEQTQLAGADDGFGAVLGLQFVENPQVMTLDRAESQV